MPILGIDPGSRATGYGVVELEGSRLRRLRGGVIRVADRSLARRLARIHAELLEVIAQTRPDAAALEAVRRGGASLIPLEQIDGVSRATFAIVESIASGQAVTVD